LNISVQAANLSDCRIESNRNFFCPNWNALRFRTLEMSPVLHGLMLSRDQTMQGDSRDLSEDGGAKHVVERLSRDAVTTEDSHHIQQTAARRQQVVYMISRTQSIIECNA